MSIRDQVKARFPHRMLANVAIVGIELAGVDIHNRATASMFTETPPVLLDRAYSRGFGLTRSLADRLDSSIATNSPPFDEYSTLLILVAAKAVDMRRVQTEYFAKRDQQVLEHSKQLEKELDALLAELASYGEARQEGLF